MLARCLRTIRMTSRAVCSEKAIVTLCALEVLNSNVGSTDIQGCRQLRPLTRTEVVRPLDGGRCSTPQRRGELPHNALAFTSAAPLGSAG
jgi:hypothetical protein